MILDEAINELNTAEDNFLNESKKPSENVALFNWRNAVAEFKRLKESGAAPALIRASEKKKRDAYAAYLRSKQIKQQVKATLTESEMISFDDIIVDIISNNDSNTLNEESEHDLVKTLFDIKYFNYIDHKNAYYKAKQIAEEMKYFNISESVISYDNKLNNYLNIIGYTSNTIDNLNESNNINTRYKIDLVEAYMNDEVSTEVLTEGLVHSLKQNALLTSVNFLTENQLNNKLKQMQERVKSLLSDNDLRSDVTSVDISELSKSEKRALLKRILRIIDNKTREQANKLAAEIYEDKLAKKEANKNKNREMYYETGMTKPQLITLLSSLAATLIIPQLIVPAIATNVAYYFINKRRYTNEAFEGVDLKREKRISGNLLYKYDITNREAMADASLDNKRARELAFDGQTGSLLQYLLTGTKPSGFDEFVPVANVIKNDSSVKKILFEVGLELKKQNPDINIIKNARIKLRQAFNTLN